MQMLITVVIGFVLTQTALLASAQALNVDREQMYSLRLQSIANSIGNTRLISSSDYQYLKTS